MSQSSHKEEKGFVESALGKFILSATAAAFIFGFITYLESIRQQGIDALRIANEAKNLAIENKQEMKDKADKSDIFDLKQDIRNFRELYEKSLRSPDVVIRYKSSKR